MGHMPINTHQEPSGFSSDRNTAQQYYTVPAHVVGDLPDDIRSRIVCDSSGLPALPTGIVCELLAELGVSMAQTLCQDPNVRVEARRKDSYLVQLQPLLQGLRNVPRLSAVLGVTDVGFPLLVHLPSLSVSHVLVGGDDGSGKTSLLRTIILSLAYFNRSFAARKRQASARGKPGITFMLVDLSKTGSKNNAFQDLEELPHLASPVIRDAAGVLGVLKTLLALMEIRMTNGYTIGDTEPVCILVIDELMHLTKGVDPEISQSLRRLLEQGRRYGIHVVAATRTPGASQLDGLVVGTHFNVRLCGKMTNRSDEFTMTLRTGVKTKSLLNPGDFMLVSSGITQLYRFRAAYIKPEEARKMVAEIREREIG